MHQSTSVSSASAELDPTRDGRDRLEYGVLATLIAAIVVLAVLALGVSSSTVFDAPCDAPAEAASSSCQAPGSVSPIRP
jgi:Flp pilus assembly pilin Flp